MSRKKVGQGFMIAATSFLAVMLAVGTAGANNYAAINSALKVKGYEIIETDPDPNLDTEYFKHDYHSADALKSAYEKLCEAVEAEGLVLLKNDGALPLDKGSKVSLFLQGSDDFNYATTGSSATSGTDSFASLKTAMERGGNLQVNGTLANFYKSSAYAPYGRKKNINGYLINEAPYSVYTEEVKNSYASFGDAAIVTISRSSGEGSDSTTAGSDGLDGSYLSISAEEKELLQELTLLKEKGTFESVIVLLNSALPIQLDFLKMEGIDVDACLWVGNTGSTGAYAIGEVLVGNVNPSGRLSDTYVYDNFSSPAMATWAANPKKSFTQTYGNWNRTDYNNTNRYYGVYVEGIYVGYRYYETRYEDVVLGRENVGDYKYFEDVAYPFGYGLSYTQFEYSDYKVDYNAEEDAYDVSVTVTNIGEEDGKEVVQIYLQKPYSDYDKINGVESAAVELVGYDKTDILKANGGEETVTVRVNGEQFRTYDSYQAKTYILDEGDFYLTAAKDSHDAVNNILAAKGKTQADGMDASGDAMLCEKVLTTTKVDVEKYARSSETKETITNQFDFMDVNLYDGAGSNKVTYVSRSNWTGTFPKEAVQLTIETEKMRKDLQSNTPVEEDGSEKPVYGESNGLTLISLRGRPYNDDSWEDYLDQMTYAQQALLITNGQHTTVALGDGLGKPETIDENGPTSVTGSVIGTCMPSEGIWASTFNDELIEEIGSMMAEDALNASPSVQGIYAPGVNMHRTPFGGRAHEYFSEDPFLTGMASIAEIKGMQSKGVIAYVKHLAFNDEETNRNGVGVWMNEQSAREIYLLPFEYSMRPSMGNAHATMTSFNRAGCVWTSASSELMLNVIRGEWAFDGFAITDMASSNGAVYMTFYDGIMNGTDLYDGSGSGTALDNYKDSARFANRMRDASHRILYIVCNYSAAMNGISLTSQIVTITPWWQIVVYALQAVGGILTLVSIVTYSIARRKERKKR